jgi:glycosyltransferase involved in cell wall biosynthesis
MKISYISWAAHCSRSDHTARELGGTSHLVYWGALGSHPLTIWLKYLGQAVRTWRLLAADRPTAVFVMTPPVFAPLVAWAYCFMRGCRFVLDAHTAAFLHPRWRHFQRLQFWLARRAAATIVHNDYLKAVIEREGGHAITVGDIPVRFDRCEPYDLPPGFNIAVVCSFNPDEPIAEMLEAARHLPDVHFHVTGNPRRGDPRLATATPANVRLTGFLSDGAYGSLITRADGVLTLTTRDHTMLRGAWEAVYQGTPVIVSNWPVLREAFDEGAIHVDNTAADIVSAVGALRQHHGQYRAGVRALCERKQHRWESTRRALIARISE